MDPNRIARNAAAGVVASIAAWSSYSHMVHVALRCGERAEVAYALPGSVDGMLVVASMVMVDDRRRHRPVRRAARVSFAVGVAASIAANVAAAHPGLPARLVAAWPAAALLLVVEMLAHRGGTDLADTAETTVQSRGAQTTDARAPADAVHSRTAGASANADTATAQLMPANTYPHSAGTPHAPHDPTRPGIQMGAAASPDAPPSDAPPVAPPPGGTPRLISRGSDATDAPPPQAAAIAANVEAPSRARRRPREEIVRLVQQQQAAEPGLSQNELARRVGVSRRRLREVLATRPDASTAPPAADAPTKRIGSPRARLEPAA